MAAQVRVADQLALPPASAAGAVLGGDRIVAVILPDLAELVASNLAIDGGAMAAKLGRDLRDRQLGPQQSKERAPLLESEVAVGAFHPRRPPKPLPGLGSRTSKWNAPRIYCGSAKMGYGKLGQSWTSAVCLLAQDLLDARDRAVDGLLGADAVGGNALDG